MVSYKTKTKNSYFNVYCLEYNTNAINHSYSTIGYDYHQHNPWEKPTYATFDYRQSPYSIERMSSIGGISSLDTMNKTNSSFDIPLNLNNSTSSLYRRHSNSNCLEIIYHLTLFFFLLAESALPTSTSIYSSSTTNHPSPSPFNYSHTMTHYHPSELFFGWNNQPSLMRTHSASFRDHSQSRNFCFKKKHFE